MTKATAGAELRKWRERKNESQLSLAIRLGTTPGAVLRWELGHGCPSLAFAVRIETLTKIPAAAWTMEA